MDFPKTVTVPLKMHWKTIIEAGKKYLGISEKVDGKNYEILQISSSRKKSVEDNSIKPGSEITRKMPLSILIRKTLENCIVFPEICNTIFLCLAICGVLHHKRPFHIFI